MSTKELFGLKGKAFRNLQPTLHRVQSLTTHKDNQAEGPCGTPRDPAGTHRLLTPQILGENLVTYEK